MTLHSYWTSKRAECPLKTQCTTGKERRIKRWEHEADAHPPRNSGAPIRHTKSLDGCHPLSDQNPRKGPNRDEPPCARLQSGVIAILGAGPLMAAMRA
jgi:hypothetical protein